MVFVFNKVDVPALNVELVENQSFKLVKSDALYVPAVVNVTPLKLAPVTLTATSALYKTTFVLF